MAKGRGCGAGLGGSRPALVAVRWAGRWEPLGGVTELREGGTASGTSRELPTVSVAACWIAGWGRLIRSRAVSLPRPLLAEVSIVPC